MYVALYSLESPLRGDSNVYTQHTIIFYGRPEIYSRADQEFLFSISFPFLCDKNAN